MELQKSNVLLLPSGRTLQVYKNSCTQDPGLNNDVQKLMILEAERLGLSDQDKMGIIALDEMSIQVMIYESLLSFHKLFCHKF